MLRQRRWRLLGSLTLVGIGVLTATWYGVRVASLRRGGALFHGQLPLQGRITGQKEVLRIGASRCINCHVASQDTGSRASFAPPLDAGFLTKPHSRRGGPASRYDERTFCVLLRSGVDPAYVMLSQEMPRYELSNQDCSFLWRYAVSR